jgi:hypothetical protein
MKRKRMNRIHIRVETLRDLTAARGGSTNQSEDGHVCESVNACPGSVAPYQCATDMCQTRTPPCNASAFGPCG